MEDSGGDWNANVEQLKAENEKLKAAGGGASGPTALASFSGSREPCTGPIH